MLLLRLLNAVFATAVLTPASDNLSQELEQNVDHSMSYQGRNDRFGDWGLVGLARSPVQKSSKKLNEDPIEDLQKQIDHLRKKLKDLEKKSQETTSQADLSTLQSQVRDLQSTLADAYKKIDQLSESQKQEFKQKLDQINSEMIKMEIDLSDRITNLEEIIQQTNINNAIGGIRDGNLETAARTLESITNIKSVIPHIISEAYGEGTRKCKSVLEFILLINFNRGKTDLRKQMLSNFVKAYAFKTLFDKLTPSVYSQEGSDCMFILAWQANKMWSTLQSYDYEASDNIRSVVLGVPLAIRYIVLDNRVYIRRNPERCEGADKKVLGDYQQWKPESYDDLDSSEYAGDYLILRNNEGYIQPLEGDGKNVYLGQNDSSMRNYKRYWKPILAANDQIWLRHRQSGKYLSYENLGSCYKYTLSESKTTWYISNRK